MAEPEDLGPVGTPQETPDIRPYLDREAQQTFSELSNLVPPAAQPLEIGRIQGLYDAASEAQERIGQMAPLSPLELEGQEFDQLPPEVAVPVMTLFSAFEAEDAPEQLQQYRSDWLTMAQTNDGLLELTTTLLRAARDPTTAAAVIADQTPAPLPGQETPQPPDSSSALAGRLAMAPGATGRWTDSGHWAAQLIEDPSIPESMKGFAGQVALVSSIVGELAQREAADPDVTLFGPDGELVNVAHGLDQQLIEALQIQANDPEKAQQIIGYVIQEARRNLDALEPEPEPGLLRRMVPESIVPEPRPPRAPLRPHLRNPGGIGPGPYDPTPKRKP